MNPALASWLERGDHRRIGAHRIFLRREGSGPALLLVHGYPTGSYDWRRVWDALAERFDVIAPDMLGLGFSDKPPRHPYGVMDHADMHEALLEQLGVRRVHVVAHDLGVSVVQELLARRLEGRPGADIASVVFLNGGLFAETYRPRAIQRLLNSPLGDLIGPWVPRAAFDRTLRELFGPDTQPTVDELRTLWDLACHGGGRRALHRVGRFTVDRLLHRDRLVRPLLAGRTPIRLVNGATDPNSGAHMAARYRELVPGADIVSLPRIGHWPQLEEPAAVLRSIRDLVERTG